MSWVKAASIDALAKKPQVLNHPPRQIAVFSVGEIVYAIDNRCPHEGYPLAVGSVGEDCMLTCNWHNWKFRLTDGECVLGGDHVRSYPTRVEDGWAWVDVTNPPPEQVRRDVLRGLRTAFDDRDFGRICREIARLEYNKLDAKDAVRKAIEWSHDRLEFGTVHSAPAAADWMSLAEELAARGSDFEDRLICMAEAVDHLAFNSLRHGAYPYAEAGQEFSSSAFMEAVEAEESGHAEAMVRRGLNDGLGWPDMEEAFVGAALAHYNDFGHSIIYVQKAGELLEQVGSDVTPFVILPLTRHLAYTTREDLIPEFKEYGPALDRLAEPALGASDSERMTIPFPTNTAGALAWLEDTISIHPVEDVYDSLLEAIALNMLHYDTSYDTATDRPVSHNVSWLGFSHGLTSSNAIRTMCEKYPRYWKQGLVQMACWAGRNRGFIDTDIDRSVWQVTDTDRFFADVTGKLLDHGMRDPIFSAHLLKTSLAVRAELAPASESCRSALLAALNRFLNSPIKMKHVRRLAHQAITLVARDFPAED